ncbi:Plant lipid transfer protein/Par allergen [Corchorus olitorius]|uniref:Plant lipid transfer protein/Par allergen n=1 Tax=Corchorus olitorius TaxID=93759 RepID=A0A1R3JH25_9ROSI|nr:Plant lipid transfer protein/Par allergen [Corchorus olitorius]
MADSAQDKDKEECTQQLVGLATCLPYVSGDAKAPTPDCCSGLKQVLKNNKKCLCVIIKDRNDPDLGLNINVTLALSLPTVCNAPANVSKCPELLHMDPNSPEAQVFYQLSKSSTSSSPAPGPSPTGEGSPVSSQSEGANKPQKGAGCRGSGKRWLGLEIVTGLTLLWYFMGSYLFI